MKMMELQNRINDAADGLLDEEQIGQLEADLKEHPDLQRVYYQILAMPDLASVFDQPRKDLHQKRIESIFTEIDALSEKTFDVVTMQWFKKYALAASIAVLGLSSLFYLMQYDTETDPLQVEEFYYSSVESESATYLTYLENWIED